VRWSARGFYVDDIDEGKEQVFTGRNSAGPCYVATAKGTGQEPNVPTLLVTASRTRRIRDRCPHGVCAGDRTVLFALEGTGLGRFSKCLRWMEAWQA
jgi:hypothetical protein